MTDSPNEQAPQPLTDEQTAELERRLEAFPDSPNVSWEEIKEKAIRYIEYKRNNVQSL